MERNHTEQGPKHAGTTASHSTHSIGNHLPPCHACHAGYSREQHPRNVRSIRAFHWHRAMSNTPETRCRRQKPSLPSVARVQPSTLRDPRTAIQGIKSGYFKAPDTTHAIKFADLVSHALSGADSTCVQLRTWSAASSPAYNQSDKPTSQPPYIVPLTLFTT
jgi:hypothetical protein